MRRFAKTLSIGTDTPVLDLYKYNYACHRAGDYPILGSALWVPSTAGISSVVPTIDEVSAAGYVVVSPDALASDDTLAILNTALTGGSKIMVAYPSGDVEDHTVPDGFLKAIYCDINTYAPGAYANTLDYDCVLFANSDEATEAEIEAWLAAVTGVVPYVGAIVEAGDSDKLKTVKGLLVGADFITLYDESEIGLTSPFDLFVGTKVKNVAVSGSVRTVYTDSHTVTYDTNSDIYLSHASLSLISKHSLECDAQVLVRTSGTEAQLATQQYFAYTEDAELSRYVQFYTAAPTSGRFTWELSEEVDLVKRASAQRLTEYLPDWMKWRTNPDSDGYGLIESVAQLTDELRTTAFESRQIPTDMPIHLMNGIAYEEMILSTDSCSDGYVDVEEHSLELFSQANSAEELLYSPVPAYAVFDGYIVRVNSTTGTKINLWTPLDEWGAYINLYRHSGESLNRFRLRILDAFQSEHGSHKEAFRKTIIRELMPPDPDDPDVFTDIETGVDVVPLTDRSMFDSQSLPSSILESAVHAQIIAGQHVYDDGRIGKAVWNADGPDHEGGARLPYRYDTDLTPLVDLTTSGTGPDDDCRVNVTTDDPIDATVTVKKTVYSTSNSANGIYPLTLAVGVSKSGSYTEYITPEYRTTVRVSVYVKDLDVAGYRDFVVEGKSNKNAINSEGNDNRYQVDFINPRTGKLVGTWKYDSGGKTYTLTESQLDTAWDSENFGPSDTTTAGKTLFGIEVKSTYRTDTEELVTSGATFDVLEAGTYALSTLSITSASTTKTGYKYFDIKFKDDEGTKTVDWTSKVFDYTLHRNNVYDPTNDVYLEDGDTVTIADILVPPHITNATTAATLKSITADLNPTSEISTTGVTVSLNETTKVLSSSVETPSAVRYPIVQHIATTTTTDTISISALKPNEVRQYSLSEKVAGALYEADSEDLVDVTYHSGSHTVTVSRTKPNTITVNPGWYWLNAIEDYYYTDLETGTITGTEKLLTSIPEPGSKITVEDYFHNYALTTLGEKTFDVSLDIEALGGAYDFYVPDKVFTDLVVTKNDDPTNLVGGTVADNHITMPSGFSDGDIIHVSYKLNNSFYYDATSNKIMLSNEAAEKTYKIQCSSAPSGTSMNISPNYSAINDYFIVLDNSDTVTPGGGIDFTIGVNKTKTKLNEPFILTIETRYKDGSIAPDVIYSMTVTNGTAAGTTSNRQTGSDGRDSIDIWPTDNVTVTVTSGGETVGTATVSKDTSNGAAAYTGARVEITAPTSMRLNFPAKILVRAWNSTGVLDKSESGTYTVVRYEMDETGDPTGTAYVAHIGSTSITTDANGYALISLTAEQLNKRGAYKMTVTVNGKTGIAVWRIY